MRAVSDFLVREVLELVVDDLTPRKIHELIQMYKPSNSFEDSESATEDSESQVARMECLREVRAPTVQHRVMMVQSTNSSEQLLTLVDRCCSIHAFVPTTLITSLQQTYEYLSLANLRGSIIRLEKYHFTTPMSCLSSPSIVSTRQSNINSNLWLFIEQLSVIDATELAVHRLSDITEHPSVAPHLIALSMRDLDQRLKVRQGLPLSPSANENSVIENNERNIMRDEDCVIPEEQEQELEAQEGWGEDEVKDCVVLQEPAVTNLPIVEKSTGSSDMTTSRSNQVGSTGLFVPQLVLQQSVGNHQSITESQVFPFAQQDIENVFVECSDIESDEEGTKNCPIYSEATFSAHPQDERDDIEEEKVAVNLSHSDEEISRVDYENVIVDQEDWFATQPPDALEDIHIVNGNTKCGISTTVELRYCTQSTDCIEENKAKHVDDDSHTQLDDSVHNEDSVCWYTQAIGYNGPSTDCQLESAQRMECTFPNPTIPSCHLDVWSQDNSPDLLKDHGCEREIHVNSRKRQCLSSSEPHLVSHSSVLPAMDQVGKTTLYVPNESSLAVVRCDENTRSTVSERNEFEISLKDLLHTAHHRNRNTPQVDASESTRTLLPFGMSTWKRAHYVPLHTRKGTLPPSARYKHLIPPFYSEKILDLIGQKE